MSEVPAGGHDVTPVGRTLVSVTLPLPRGVVVPVRLVSLTSVRSTEVHNIDLKDASRTGDVFAKTSHLLLVNQ